jgi:hypothetical protein
LIEWLTVLEDENRRLKEIHAEELIKIDIIQVFIEKIVKLSEKNYLLSSQWLNINHYSLCQFSIFYQSKFIDEMP